MDRTLPLPLIETLDCVADAMAAARDPWWIIASAAMALHGARPIDVADVDLLLSERDAGALVDSLGLVPAHDGGSARFRSRLFARWEAPPLPVEIMAGFAVRVDDDWRLIEPASRHLIQIGNKRLFVPSVAELLAHCRLFGRPKDERRAAILQRLDS